MKYPTYGSAELVRNTRDLPHVYKGQMLHIPTVTGDFCPNCDEAVLDMAESMRSSVAMLAFNKQVNASIIDPGYIAAVRKKLAKISSAPPSRNPPNKQTQQALAESQQGKGLTYFPNSESLFQYLVALTK